MVAPEPLEVTVVVVALVMDRVGLVVYWAEY